MEVQPPLGLSNDPRRLRDLVNKAEKLAQEHGLRSVLVGLSGMEGDRAFSGVVDYVESALRMDDAVFRMTRDRVVLLLTDVDGTAAHSIVDRLLNEYREHAPSMTDPTLGLGTYEIGPDSGDNALKHVLPILFASPPKSH